MMGAMSVPRVETEAYPTAGLRPLLGEPLALDLVNTVWRQPAGVRDVLADDDDLRLWLATVPAPSGTRSLAGARRPPALRAQRAALLEARTAIRGVLEAREDPAALAALNEILAHGHVQPTLSVDGPTEEVSFDEARWIVPWRAAQNLLELLGGRPHRVRGCADEACGLFFFDVTRSGTRRWCSMEACGNRAKARRHYARVRTEA